jgi:hypothetical protein
MENDQGVNFDHLLKHVKTSHKVTGEMGMVPLEVCALSGHRVTADNGWNRCCKPSMKSLSSKTCECSSRPSVLLDWTSLKAAYVNFYVVLELRLTFG